MILSILAWFLIFLVLLYTATSIVTFYNLYVPATIEADNDLDVTCFYPQAKLYTWVAATFADPKGFYELLTADYKVDKLTDLLIEYYNYRCEREDV